MKLKKHLELVKISWCTQQPPRSQALTPLVQDPTRIAELKIAVFISKYWSNLSVDHLGELISASVGQKMCMS